MACHNYYNFVSSFTSLGRYRLPLNLIISSVYYCRLFDKILLQSINNFMSKVSLQIDKPTILKNITSFPKEVIMLLIQISNFVLCALCYNIQNLMFGGKYIILLVISCF